MATMPKPAAIFENLSEIVGQVEEAKTADRDQVMLSNQTRAISNRLTSEEALKMLSDKGFTSEQVAEVSNVLSEFSKALNPQASIIWDKDAVNAQLNILDGLATMGYLDETEVEALAKMREALKAARVSSGGTGQRSPREAQERIENRPPWVVITDDKGNRVSKQIGNVKSSASNLKNRAVKFLEDAGVKVDDAGAKGLLTAAKAVTEGNEPESTFGGLTFTQATE